MFPSVAISPRGLQKWSQPSKGHDHCRLKTLGGKKAGPDVAGDVAGANAGNASIDVAGGLVEPLLVWPSIGLECSSPSSAGVSRSLSSLSSPVHF
mmetsp:Transcript_159875/g.291862  ORF Transcript_159875/g.291862 Transcript_159875/m.291862 type:complete len:95 (-) Transcript_159875:236-520(-)